MTGGRFHTFNTWSTFKTLYLSNYFCEVKYGTRTPELTCNVSMEVGTLYDQEGLPYIVCLKLAVIFRDNIPIGISSILRTINQNSFPKHSADVRI